MGKEGLPFERFFFKEERRMRGSEKEMEMLDVYSQFNTIYE